MSDQITITTTAEWLFEAASLVYSSWSKAYTALKAVKAERNDGSKDWAEFHARRLTHAIEQEAIWLERKNEATRISTLVMNRTTT